MNKIKFSLLAIVLFVYIGVPSRSITLLPDNVMEHSISLFNDLKPVGIKGYKVFNAGVLPLDKGYLYVTRKSGESIIDAAWNRFFLKKNTKGLQIGELDENFNEIKSIKTRYGTDEFVEGKEVQYIDARLLRVGSDIYMVYCRQVNNKNKKISRAGLQLAKLEKKEGKWEVVSDRAITFNETEEFYDKGLVKRNFEKNWMPFSRGGKLYFIYLMDPEHVVLKADLETGKAVIYSRIENTFSSPPFQLRGSTPAVYDEELGEWITLYHFILPTVKNTGKSTVAYFVGGYTFSKNSPHKILRKSDEVFVGKNFYHKKKFVFPISLVRDGDDYLMFYGDDDETNMVARIPRKDLIDSMKEIDTEKMDGKEFL